MIEFKGEFARVLGALDGSVEVTVTTKDKRIVDRLKVLEGELNIQLDKWKEKRSLNANSYFHKLVGDIAEKTNTGVDETKKIVVCDYGTVAFIARIPQDADLDAIYPYNKFIGESRGTKQPCYDYYVFKPTHTLNASEMARLIDGVVREAQQLGIETRTPNEIASLVDLWGN